MMRELESAAGFVIDGLVNNTNLLSFSTVNDLVNANEVLKEVQKETGIPLVFASGMDVDYPALWGNALPDHTPFLRLSRTISYEEPILYDSETDS